MTTQDRVTSLRFDAVIGSEGDESVSAGGEGGGRTSVAVLLKVYAKFLDGGEQDARAKVERMLRPPEPGDK